MKTTIAAAMAIGAIAALPPQSIAAKKHCSSSYESATIGGKHKCLRAGEVCSHKKASQYVPYHFKCRLAWNGTYLLVGA